jgi:predicted ATPase
MYNFFRMAGENDSGGKLWHVTLLGGLMLQSHQDVVVRRFRSQKTAALLAYLALHLGRDCSREVLCEVLWPEDDNSEEEHIDAEKMSGRLRFCLSSLRKQLEPSGVPFGAVLDTSVSGIVRLRREAVTTDVVELERAQKTGDVATMQTLLAKGELLPTFYDDWVITWRNRIEGWREQLPDSPAPMPPTPVSPSIAPPVMARPRYLPLYLTRFFGREKEQSAIKGLLYRQSRRLVTIQGMGGCGKTRLAVEIAHQMVDHFAEVAFVPLAECHNPAQILDRVRPALRLPSAETPPLEQVVCAFGGTPMLLVLDNLEHLMEGGALEVLEILLQALPLLSCLVTSRIVLGIEGEQVFPLQPLTPDSEASIALFVDRAQAGQPDFALTPRNKKDILVLCQDLEGLPLALELAATRVRIHGLASMRQQIEEEGRRFALLARTDAAARKTPRHASLHAVVASSWRLLSPPEQECLATLSLLRGHWSMALAIGVTGREDVATLLETLVAHALVQVDVSTPETPRFFLLQTIHEFAQEQLNREQLNREQLNREQLIGDKRTDAQQRYAAFVLAYLADATTREGVTEEDLPSLQAALENAIERGKTTESLSLCLALEEVWLRLGNVTTAASLLTQALALPSGEPLPLLRVRVLDIAVYLTKATLEPARAQELAAQALVLAGTDPHARAVATIIQARVAYRNRAIDDVLIHSLGVALATAEQVQDTNLEADIHLLLGLISTRLLNFDLAMHHTKRAKQLQESQKNRRGAARAVYNLGVIATKQGDYLLALEYYQIARATAETLHDAEQLTRIQNNIGDCLAHLQRWEESYDALQACLRLAQAIGNQHSILLALWNIAEPMAHLGKPGKSLQIVRFTQQQWQKNHLPPDPEDEAYIAQIQSLAERDTNTPLGKIEMPTSLESAIALAWA